MIFPPVAGTVLLRQDAQPRAAGADPPCWPLDFGGVLVGQSPRCARLLLVARRSSSSVVCQAGRPFFAAALGVGSVAVGQQRRWRFLGDRNSGDGHAWEDLLAHQFVRDDGLRDLFLAADKRSSAIDAAEWCERVGGKPIANDWAGRRRHLSLHLVLACRRRAELLIPSPLGRLVVLPLVFAGLINVLLFREGAFVHEYYCFYLSAPVAVLAGLFMRAPERADDATGANQADILARRASEAASESASLARRAGRAHRGLAFVALVAVSAHSAQTLTAITRQQSIFYAPEPPESREFVKSIAKVLAERFPPGATIMVDALAHSEALAYYADCKLEHLGVLSATQLNDWLRQPTGGAMLNLDQPRTAQIWLELQRLHAGGPYTFADGIAIEGHRFGVFAPRVADLVK